LAQQHGLPVHVPEDVNAPEFVATLRGYAPDLLFSFYFRDLLSQEILDLPMQGGLNLHGSLLPQYRGCAPVNWVLVNGETETGVTLHYMMRRADAGDIVAQRRVPIAFEDTARTLYDKITVAAREVIRETWPLLREGRAPRWPQDLSQGSYFGRRTPADGKIDWTWPAVRIYNLIRAVTHPYPGAFTFLGGRKLFVWWGQPLAGFVVRHAAPAECRFHRANGTPLRSVPDYEPAEPGTVTSVTPEGPRVATGDGELLLRRVQFEGEPELAGEELARDERLRTGTQMG
jgi:methionyl-tRNA formyltransferase